MDQSLSGVWLGMPLGKMGCSQAGLEEQLVNDSWCSVRCVPHSASNLSVLPEHGIWDGRNVGDTDTS